MKKLPVLQIAVVSLLLFAGQAHAAPLDSTDLLNNILGKYSDVAATWQSKIVGYASWLFWGLVLISMVWTFGLMALKNAGLQEALAELVKFFAVTGFFWWILENGPAIASSIMDSMRQVAAQTSGLGTNLSPSGLVDIGFDILSKTRAAASPLSPVFSVVSLIVAGINLIVLALVGINMLLLLISGWFLAYAGVFLLGFGGARWTTDIAIGYYKMVLGIGIQLFAMILVVGIGKSFIDQYYDAFANEGAPDLNSLFVMLVTSIVLLVLVNKLPPMLASIVGGGSTAGIGGFGANHAAAAVATAGAAVATAGAAIAAGAAGVMSGAAGGASALKAAFQGAQENMAHGTGLFSEASSDVGSGSVSDSNTGSSAYGSAGNAGVFSSGADGGRTSSKSGGSSGFASAMGNAGRFVTDMGANLAKGATQVAVDKAGNAMGSLKGRAADTTGGRIAAAIRNSYASVEAGNDISTQPASEAAPQAQEIFDGDSLEPGGPLRASADKGSTNDEVIAFVNRRTPRNEA